MTTKHCQQEQRMKHRRGGETLCVAQQTTPLPFLHTIYNSINYSEEVLDGMQTEEQLAEALRVVNEVTDTKEEEAGVEEQEEASAVINCISCGKRYFG
ncbi:hypothetical protein Pcinc_016556 [Petrolisthes cinctipes]|uniref:Uncharacterized protein n=1 Tax=Petrolisthes cinctipes TaxID=88211 RepID=A0AAE1FQN6_PETCI|nr:hypothetical protein Pcinc_016556 [Petrolisthes cinctipes]